MQNLRIELDNEEELDLLIDGLGFVIENSMDENNWAQTVNEGRAKRAAGLRSRLKLVKSAKMMFGSKT